MQHLEVIAPTGMQLVEQRSASPRLPTLDGRTVGEVWNGVFRGDETFPVLRAELLRRYPGLRIVPYTEFPFFPGDDRPHAQQAAAREIAATARAKGCDALISGNGA